MKQIGNLAIVCSFRSDVLLQVRKPLTTLFVGAGPDRETIFIDSNNDAHISDIIYELNHGKLKLQEEK